MRSSFEREIDSEADRDEDGEDDDGQDDFALLRPGNHPGQNPGSSAQVVVGIAQLKRTK